MNTITIVLKTGKTKTFEKAALAVDGGFLVVQQGDRFYGWEASEVKSFEVVKKSG